MAIRINVTAVRNCRAADLRAVMSEVLRPMPADSQCQRLGDQLDICEHGGWTWFSTSVWGVGSDDLNRGLCKLARPSLQFTTSDGDRWYLWVHGAPSGRVHFLHEFAYHSYIPNPDDDDERQAQLDQCEEPVPIDPRLAFLHQELPDRSAGPRVPFDLIADALNEMGAEIPEEFRASVADLPYSAAAQRYRDWHADEVSNALTRAGIVHDAAAVRSVLLWQDVTDNERGSDLGNLPRLLSILGLGGQWDDWVRQAECPTAPPDMETDVVAESVAPVPCESSSESDDPFASVDSIVVPLELTAVAGGPFDLSLDDMTLIRFFIEALSIHDTANVVLAVTLPGGSMRPDLSMSAAGGFFTLEPTSLGFRLAITNHLWFNQRDLTDQLGDKLSGVLLNLPDGSTIDVASALAGKPALTQRYRGPVAGGRWQIAESFPLLTCEALASAIEWARYAAGDPERHELRDEAEAEAVVELARRDPLLWDSKVVRKGRIVWCKSDIVGHLPKLIFRRRFAEYWDVAAQDREAAVQLRKYLDMQRQMRRAGAEAARRRAAPHDDEVLLQGKCGRYWRADLTQLEQLEQETLEKFDASMAGLGFTHAGDLVAKKQRDVVVRGYAGADGVCYAVLMAKRTMYLGYEFFSRFADGSRLTTTTNGAVESQPQFKVYAQVHPRLQPDALSEKHLWGIEQFRSHKGTKPVPLEPTLRGVAEEYDRALALRLGVALQFRIVAPPPGEAPSDIRAAWVGCIVPLFATTDDPRVGRKTKGVLSRQETSRRDGFAARVTDAIDALERHDASAARWWREKTPDSLRPGQLFVFASEACELVET
jgi:hypothetical protein